MLAWSDRQVEVGDKRLLTGGSQGDILELNAVAMDRPVNENSIHLGLDGVHRLEKFAHTGGVACEIGELARLLDNGREPENQVHGKERVL